MNALLFFAALPARPGLLTAASAVAGGTASLFCWVIWRALRSEDLPQGAEWRYDISRINELRRADPLFRLFQPLIRSLAWMNRRLFRESLPGVLHDTQAAGMARSWLPEEYLARAQLVALFTTPLQAFVLASALGPGELPLLLLTVPMTAWWLRYRLSVRARDRIVQIKRRLPFLLDLLTLLMEAGATFLNALKQSVDEFRGHPVAEEFGRVLADMNLGKTRTDALQSMRDRLADDEIAAVIGAIIQGEQLGTPLAHLFRVQADTFRIKRSQRAEAAAGEAGVKMLLPGVLVMAATVLIILGPFLLNFLKFGLSF